MYLRPGLVSNLVSNVVRVLLQRSLVILTLARRFRFNPRLLSTLDPLSISVYHHFPPSRATPLTLS